jgi:hypothetical protein
LAKLRLPFTHLSDDELKAANHAADARYCDLLESEMQYDRASWVEWMVKTGDASTVVWAYQDEFKRREKLRAAILNPVLLGSMEVTAETSNEELDRFLFNDGPHED